MPAWTRPSLDPQRAARPAAIVFSLVAAVGAVGCGARSGPLDDEAETTCAAEDRRARDHCAATCASLSRDGRQESHAANDAAPSSEVGAPADTCVDACLGEMQRECETTSCGCAFALTKLAGSGLRR
ncbi:MAG: hypothetical protein KF850_14170 [Labilithrix sp.]|nr:hypothetical protein [Labilithrix sp.]